ncbi:unnamed protein product [Periconia digitata]|uniref:Uncharacterized protein n=1 Tax=Periconia digitata TaxID=1303443 RepID=A0A9W4UTJ2_9PLEO|nr:unnamed protein product [Periconia digitata]
MQFSYISISALVATALSMPTEMPLERRGGSMTHRFCGRTDCRTQVGPTRTLGADKCIKLSDSDHGIQVKTMSKGCELSLYTNRDHCDEKPLKSLTTSPGNVSLQGVYRIRLEC